MSDDFNEGRAPLHWSEIACGIVLVILAITVAINALY